MESAGKRKTVPPDLKNRTAVKSASRAPSGKASDIVVDIASPFSASFKGSCFKENVNTNKSEIPKLNMEPLQMKRKKKGGGYNLRKSLTWDRAFFTDEGVLDPLELSVISAASCRGLPITDEHPLGSSQPHNESHDLQKLKSYPLKELPGEDLGDDGRRHILLPKSYSSSNMVESTSLTSNKVSTQFGRKSGSQCADCVQLLPSSSLKRPATVNHVKATAKELKLPKNVLCSKSGFGSVCTMKNSILGANIVKHNQIAQSGLRISSQNIKNMQKQSKASSLRPTCNPEQNSGASSIKRHSWMDMSPLLGSQTYDPASNSISVSMTPSKPMHSSDGQDQSRTLAARASQNPQVSGTVMQSFQNHTMKPSGLRMPSPSLSFFHQPKVSVLNNLSVKETENIDVCGSQKPGNVTLPDTFGETTKISNSSMDNKCDRSTAIFSRPQLLMPCTADAVLCKALNIEQACNKNMANDCEMSQQSKTCELVKIDKVILSIMGKNHPCGSGLTTLETVAQQTNKLQRSDGENAIDEQCKQPNTSKFSVRDHDANANFGTYREDPTDHKGHKFLTMQNGWNDASEPACHEQCREQTDELEFSFSENNKTSDKNKDDGKTEEKAIEAVELSQLYKSPSDEEENFEGLEHIQVGTVVSDLGSHQDGIILKEADSVDVMIDKLHSGGADKQDAVFASTILHCKNNINLVSEVGDDAIKSGIYTMAKKVYPIIEQGILRNCEFHTSDTDNMPTVKDICGNNLEASSQILQEGALHINNQSNELVQSPESNTLNEYYLEHLELPAIRSADNMLSDSNDGLHFFDHLQNEGTVSNENCEDCLLDQSSIKPISDPNMIQFSKVGNISNCELQPISDNDKVESTLAASNKYEADDNKEIHASFLRENAVPFSDEWLAAIEAAGEAILTKKSGAVQNSPPHKYLPEPSPWSPVKKKNNQIGPFDCTKFNNLH